jgi:hypothetical protein
VGVFRHMAMTIVAALRVPRRRVSVMAAEVLPMLRRLWILLEAGETPLREQVYTRRCKSPLSLCKEIVRVPVADASDRLVSSGTVLTS